MYQWEASGQPAGEGGDEKMKALPGTRSKDQSQRKDRERGKQSISHGGYSLTQL